MQGKNIVKRMVTVPGITCLRCHSKRGSKSPESSPSELSLECRLYGHLFKSADPQALGDKWLGDLKADSKVVVRGAVGSPVLAEAAPGDKFQFERMGYFCVDPDSAPGRPVLNRTVTLREGEYEDLGADHAAPVPGGTAVAPRAQPKTKEEKAAQRAADANVDASLQQYMAQREAKKAAGGGRKPVSDRLKKLRERAG